MSSQELTEARWRSRDLGTLISYHELTQKLFTAPRGSRSSRKLPGPSWMADWLAAWLPDLQIAWRLYDWLVDELAC